VSCLGVIFLPEVPSPCHLSCWPHLTQVLQWRVWLLTTPTSDHGREALWLPGWSSLQRKRRTTAKHAHGACWT
jgi:hypothetical protein